MPEESHTYPTRGVVCRVVSFCLTSASLLLPHQDEATLSPPFFSIPQCGGIMNLPDAAWEGIHPETLHFGAQGLLSWIKRQQMLAGRHVAFIDSVVT